MKPVPCIPVYDESHTILQDNLLAARLKIVSKACPVSLSTETMNVSDIGLSTKASVLKEARAIATYHLGGQTASAKQCILQGMFSRTIDVAMKDKKHYIVQ
jgi:hypothetical protein